MNRVRPIHACLLLLLSPLILGTSSSPALSQGLSKAGRPPHGKPFVDVHAPLPPSVTRKVVRNSRGGPIVAQTVDLTPNTAAVDDRNPSIPKSGNPSGEFPMVIQSNRDPLDATKVLGDGTAYHIYRLNADGSGATALTGPGAPADATGNLIGTSSSQSEPSLNQAASSLVYVDTSTSGAVSLKELDLNSHVLRTLLPNDLFQPTAINHPEYGFSLSGAGYGILFAAKTAADPHFHVYVVDGRSGQVTQVTFGVADDMNPALSPDPTKPAIAFDSNRADAAGTATKATRDVWVVGINPTFRNADAIQVTNFSAGGQLSNNIQPAWSTNKLDQPTGTQHFVNGQQLLGFASTRMDTANDGNANAINPNGTHDIYWLKATVGPNPNAAYGGVFTVTTPEAPAGNAALKLSTNDPQHQYDDVHPTWPQFVTTYRVVYNTDRSQFDAGSGNSGPNGQPNDIFASTLIDINAPTLVRFDDVTGEIVDVSPRITSPGTTVTIKVKIADLESGMPLNDPVYGDGVFVQVKNPNSKYQSSDGLEHKVFAFTSFRPDNQHDVLNVPVEYESEPIFIGADPADARFNTYPRPSGATRATPPTYTASISDYYAYSGSASAPASGWLPLKFESRDPSTGIATYSATWKTDIHGSDYILDVVAYDQATNPFSATNRDRAMNWKIYDNVGGFSTQPFQAAHNILMVSDNATGQKFFNTRFGVADINNVSFTFWGTESWMTDIDVRLLPTQYSGNPPGVVANVLNNLGVKSYFDSLADDGTRVDGYPVAATQQYDLWRIICRGPMPAGVLAQYQPHAEQQPADVLNGEKTPRSVLVAPRCVFWNAPYTGDTFVGPGSLTDLATQALLHNFLQTGGRLLVSGQDIAWALTLDGAVPSNPFLTGDLRAAYANDTIPNTLVRSFPYGSIGLFPYTGWISDWNRLLGAADYNPIVGDPWHGPKGLDASNHAYLGPPTSFYSRIDDETEYLIAGINPGNPQIYDYGCPNAVYPDSVVPAAGTVWDLNFNNSAGGPTAVMHYADPATKSRVVYAPMGIEGLNAHAFTDNNILYLKNRRAELFHNAACWMRTGSISGKVVDLEAGNPMPGVIVRLANVYVNNKPVVAYTGTTRDDGTYEINGVLPDDYEVTAIKAGYTIQKRTWAVTHGGFRDDASFRMTKAEPSVITGKVTRTDGKTPVVGATVTASDMTSSAVFTATTDANGNYTIERIPAQTKYTLTATAPGFGTSIPVNYTVPDPVKDPNDTLVVPSKTYTGYDFQLKAEVGAVTGHVFVKNADGSKGAPIAGAVVTATMGTLTVTATTDSAGLYSFNKTNTPDNGLDPGTWLLVAAAPGYQPNSPAVSVTITSNQTTTAADILLGAVPPGSISGLVTRTADGAPLEGVSIELKDPAGTVTATTTTGPVQTGTGGYRYNYLIQNVPAGVTYTVTPSKSGFTAVPTSKSAAVTSGTETQNINFAMDALHTFVSNLTLVSAPYDYPGSDVAQLLSVPPTDSAFTFATWDAARYVFYPTPPANTFRLGRGYFLAYRTNLPLSIQGTSAPTTQPFDISLTTGWNLVGDPFLLDIDWTKVKVVNSAGLVVTHDQAVAQGLIGAALFSYVSGGYVLDFKLSPWKGYWVRAYSNVTLRIDPTTDVYGRSAAVAGTSRALMGGGTGWTVNLRASVGGLHDDDNYLGVSTAAADGYDGFKAEKPPVFGDRYVRVTFNHDNWAARSGGYGVDVRSAAPGTKAWEFTVATTEANGTATISWPTAAATSRGLDLTLTDLATGTVRDMRSSASYSWLTGDKPVDRKFRIEATRASRSQLVVSGVVARQSANRAGGVSINYNLSAAANVEVRILSANGATVRSLSGRASRAAGINQASWDQKNDRAVAMPAGTYLIEIRAQTTDGKQTVRQTVPIVIAR